LTSSSCISSSLISKLSWSDFKSSFAVLTSLSDFWAVDYESLALFLEEGSGDEEEEC